MSLPLACWQLPVSTIACAAWVEHSDTQATPTSNIHEARP